MNEFLIFLKKNNISKTHQSIVEKLLNNDVDAGNLINYYKDYLKYKHLMHNDSIVFEDFFRNKYKKEDLDKGVEFFGDNVYAAILRNKAKRLKKSIMSNKYSNLEFVDIDKVFEVFIEENISREQIQSLLTKKIASIKTSYDFEDKLNEIIDELVNWSPEHLLDKIKKENFKSELIHTEDNKILLKITSGLEAKRLGSPMWCISRDKKYYNDYTNDLNFFCFLYDFNKKPQDKDSKIAFLVGQKNIHEVYLKDDSILSIEKTKEYNERYDKEIPKRTDKEIKIEINNMLKKKRTIKSRSYFSNETINFFKKDQNAENLFFNMKSKTLSELTKEQKSFLINENIKSNKISEKMTQNVYNEIMLLSLNNGFTTKKMSESMETLFCSKELDENILNSGSKISKKEGLRYLLNASQQKNNFNLLNIIKEKKILNDTEILEILDFSDSSSLLFLENKMPKIINEKIKQDGSSLFLDNFIKDLKSEQWISFNYFNEKVFRDSIVSLSEKMGEDNSNRFNDLILFNYFNDLKSLADILKKTPKLLNISKIDDAIKKNLKESILDVKGLSEYLKSENKEILELGNKIVENIGLIELDKINFINRAYYEEIPEILKHKHIQELLKESANKAMFIEDFVDFEKVLKIVVDKKEYVNNLKNYLHNYLKEEDLQNKNNGTISIVNKIRSDDYNGIIKKINEYEKTSKKKIKKAP